MDTKTNHPYHIVALSPWPICCALSLLISMVGLVLLMHEITTTAFISGILLLFVSITGWVKDIIEEAHNKKQHTKAVQRGLRLGIILFIASEIMFFVSFFWAYFDFSLFPSEVLGSTWPPKGIKTISPFRIPLLNTLILLLSGTSITWAHQELLEENSSEFKKGLIVTITLGLLFLGIQVFEYIHISFDFKNNLFGSIFFISTGFHGVHVLIGCVILTLCLFRALYGHFTKNHHVGFEAAAWYWHFVDVVWLFLFVWIYWWTGV